MIRRIVADSSCDLHSFSGADFISVPLKIITAKQEYIDDARLNAAKMAESLRQYKGRSSTACPNASDWESAFAGADEIFVLTITSALSGSFNAAQCAKSQYESAHPGCRIFLIDSLSTGPEMLLLVEQLHSMLQLHMDFDDICNEITTYQQRTHLLFLLSSVKNLSRNGRISHLGAEAIGLLGLRLCGQASPEGTLELLGKCRGQTAGLRRILRQMEASGWSGGKVRISHCLALDAAEELERMLKAQFPELDIQLRPAGGLCSFYAETGGLLVGFET